jgi:hypothetical protein
MERTNCWHERFKDICEKRREMLGSRGVFWGVKPNRPVTPSQNMANTAQL